MPGQKSTRAAKHCGCGCGQAPASTTRLRKASCGCGASIIRLSRVALQSVNASCIACGGELLPDCLFDRAAAGGPDAQAAVDALETREDARAARAEPKSTGRRAPMFRCGDCQAIRKAVGSCASCGSERPPTTGYMHPRAARAVGGDMPF